MRKMLLVALAVGGLALVDARPSQAQNWGIQIGVGQPGGTYFGGYYAPNNLYAYPRYNAGPGYYSNWNNPGYGYYNRSAMNYGYYNSWNGYRGYPAYSGHHHHHHHCR